MQNYNFEHFIYRYEQGNLNLENLKGCITLVHYKKGKGHVIMQSWVPSERYIKRTGTYLALRDYSSE